MIHKIEKMNIPFNKYCAFIAVIFLGILYVYKGMPFPHIDDLVIVGVAQSLASGGGLRSAVIAPDFYNTVGSDMFYYYPPIYLHIVSLWVKVFSSSGVSLQLFCFFTNLVGAASIFQIGRILEVSRISLYVISGMYFLFFASLGLRSEVTAISFLFLGCYLLLKYENPLYGLSSLLFSVLVYPVTVPAGILIILYALYIRLTACKKTFRKYFLNVLFASMLVLVLFFVYFGLLINWDFFEFARVYMIQVQTQNPGNLFSFERFSRYIELLTVNSKYLQKWPFVILGILSILFSIFYKKIPAEKRFFTLILMSGAILGGGLAHLRSVEFSLLASFICIVFILDSILKFNPVSKLISLSLIVFLFSIANSLTVLRIVFQKNMVSKVDLPLEHIILQSQNNNSIVLIDASIARYLLNWDIPANTYDITMSRDILNSREKRICPKSKTDLRIGEIAILSKTFYDDGWAETGPSKLKIFGKTIPPINLYACEPFIVTNEFSDK